MTNREWLLNKMQNMSDEEFVRAILANELNICEEQSEKCGSLRNCVNCKMYWLQQEHKEPITLSEAERIILENIDKEYKWIVRDKDGEIRVFGVKPRKDKYYWKETGNDFARLSALNHLFQFITWNDEQPYSIEELLKGE